jgi:N-acetylneuraminate synthase
MTKVKVIAEIGINHNGDIDIAKKLIDVATVAGCDVVKFQKRNPDICVPEHQKNILRDTPWGEMTYLEYKYKVEFGKEEYDEIDRYCKERGILWSASPWDLDSLEFLMQYDIPFIKIPSAMITDEELMFASKNTGKKVIISTGMSTFAEIERAIAILNLPGDSAETLRPRNFDEVKAGVEKNFAVLHCNSTYPAPINELNLSAIKTLKDRFKCEVGYSGHEFGLTTSMAAVYLGATIIERHITLDRTMWGTDQTSSVEPHGLIKLVKAIRDLESSYGDGKIYVTKSEESVRKKLRGTV